MNINKYNNKKALYFRLISQTKKRELVIQMTESNSQEFKISRSLLNIVMEDSQKIKLK
jgi:hypothetical protein